jgi:limonene-1,2-epoxide hydrolase
MKVPLFGNTSSPAVAAFGIRKTAQVEEARFGSDAREFVERDFYVDDGLKSLPGSAESIDLLRRTQAMLATANLRLHKIASNDSDVTNAFPLEDQQTKSARSPNPPNAR